MTAVTSSWKQLPEISPIQSLNHPARPTVRHRPVLTESSPPWVGGAAHRQTKGSWPRARAPFKGTGLVMATSKHLSRDGLPFSRQPLQTSPRVPQPQPPPPARTRDTGRAPPCCRPPGTEEGLRTPGDTASRPAAFTRRPSCLPHLSEQRLHQDGRLTLVPVWTP